MGDGQTKRNPTTLKALPTTGRDGVDNVYAMFASAVKSFPSNPCFGTRPKDATGVPKPFEWLTFGEAHKQVLDLASGVAALGLSNKATFGLYAANCMAFQVVTLGMFSQGYTCVPVYDTLGEDIIEYEVWAYPVPCTLYPWRGDHRVRGGHHPVPIVPSAPAF